MEAVAMFSADGEKVEFNTQVTLEGPVEVGMMSRGFHVFYTWFTRGFHMIYMWFTREV